GSLFHTPPRKDCGSEDLPPSVPSSERGNLKLSTTSITLRYMRGSPTCRAEYCLLRPLRLFVSFPFGERILLSCDQASCRRNNGFRSLSIPVADVACLLPFAHSRRCQ